MVKEENTSCPSPGVPPGFESLAAAVENRPIQNGGFSEQEQGRRRTKRKRFPPEFFQPPTLPRRATSPRGGPLPAASPRRRGRPAKARVISLISFQDAQTQDSNNVTSAPLRGQGQRQMPYFMKPVMLTKEQSSSQAKNQVEPEPNMNGMNHAVTIDKNKARSISRSNFFQARSIEEGVGNISLAEVPRCARSKNVGCSNKMIEGIDPKILQHVASALECMNGSQTPIEYKNVYSRTIESEKNLLRIQKAIEKKYGDITKNCKLESDCMKALVVVGICRMVQDLQKERLKDLDIFRLDSYYSAVRDAENLKVNVQWLRERLDEIKDAVTLSSEAKGIENERNGRLLNIDRKNNELVLRRGELEKLESEVREMEEQLAQEVLEVDELDKKYENHMSRIPQFLRTDLMDQLV